MAGKEDIKVAIIGAGIAGLAAADSLLKYGFKNIRIFEGLTRIGGRIHPVPFEDGYLDLGATFVHGKYGNPVYDLAKELGALCDLREYRYGRKSHMHPIGQDKPEIRPFIEWFNAATNLDKRPEAVPSSDNSLGKYLDRKFLKWPQHEAYTKLYDQQKEKLAGVDGASDMDKISFRLDEIWEDLPGGAVILLNKFGYHTVLQYFWDRLKDDVQFHFESHVTNVSWKSEPQLTIDKEGIIRNEAFDHAIITCSIGYLKHNHHSLFNPPLPHDKQQVIDRMGYDTLDKVMCVFDKPFWENLNLTSAFSLIPSNDDPFPKKSLESAFYFVSTVHWKNNILLFWIQGNHPERVEKASDEELTSAITNVLRRYFKDVSPPKQIIRSFWHTHPFFCGSYGYYNTDSDQLGNLGEILSYPLPSNCSEVPRLLFAGEATHPKWFQTVHGALDSGKREAERLRKYYDC